MIIELGRISALFRYPVKSMAGTAVDSAMLGWHGLEGDRRFAFRRLADTGGFPWLSASKLPALLLYEPFGRDTSIEEPLPTHVRTPEGISLELRGDELRSDVSRRFGSDVELMRLNHGIFDEGDVSIITDETIRGIEHHSERKLDNRRFRPNIILETAGIQPFGEDGWVGGTLVFGDPDSGAAVTITMPDLRCMMINLDPDTAIQDPAVMKTVVRMNNNNAGVYGSVARTGAISVGQKVILIPGSHGIAHGID
jgi:uncharacterized protein YcbX